MASQCRKCYKFFTEGREESVFCPSCRGATRKPAVRVTPQVQTQASSSVNINQPASSVNTANQPSTVNQPSTINQPASNVNTVNQPSDDISDSQKKLLESLQLLEDIPVVNFKEKFTERRFIAEGGFGIVYKANWRNINVAVKEIKLSLETKGPDVLLTIKKELDILSNIRHDRTLSLLHVCRDKEKVYLVTKYYPRQSLHHLLEEGPLNNHKYCVLLNDICEGLTYLHNYEPYPIYHLDMKPKNILIDGITEPRAVIADFGISSMKSDSQRSVCHAGSYAYMAPELGSGKPTDKNDMYALAIIMWEMLYRTNPYPNIEHHQVPFVVSKGKRPGWDKQPGWDQDNFSIFEDIKVIITQCWEPEPKKRPSSREVLYKVEEIMLSLKNSQNK